MLKGYRTESFVKESAGLAKTIEQKREIVIGNIDKWLDALNGNATLRTRKLSKLEADGRHVCLRYGNQYVALTDEGHSVGIIDAGQDEAEFWEWLKAEIRAGKYDQGIRDASDRMHAQLDAGKAKKN